VANWLDDIFNAAGSGVVFGSPTGLQVGGANLDGVSTDVVRADHKHAFPAFGTTVGTLAQGNDSRFAIDRDRRRVVGMEDYLVGTLSDPDDFATALQAAIDDAYTEADGLIVEIPHGVYDIQHHGFTMSETSVGQLRRSVSVRGAGKGSTWLQTATGYTGTIFDITCAAVANTWGFAPSVSGMALGPVGASGGNTGTCIRLRGAIFADLREIVTYNMTAGTSLYIAQVPPGGLGQGVYYLSVADFNSNGALDGCRLADINVATFDKCRFNGTNSSVKFLGSISGLTFDTCAFENNGTYMFHVDNSVGAESIFVSGGYYEGTLGSAAVYAPTAGTSSREFIFFGFEFRGGAAEFAHLEGGTDTVTALDSPFINNATKLLYARNGARGNFIRSCPGYSTIPAKFDLDSASAANLTVEPNAGAGDPRWTANLTTTQRLIPDKGVRLPGHATGAEPASPAAGDIHRDSTVDRPVMYTSVATWRPVGFYDDPQELLELLAPYSVAIYDASKFKDFVTVTVVSTLEITSWADSLTGGSLLSAASAARRPTYLPSSTYFGGRPAVSFSSTVNNSMLSGTLATPVTAGQEPGFFIVGRKSTAGVAGARRGFAWLGDDLSSPTEIYLQCGGHDTNDGANRIYTFSSGSGSSVVGPTTGDIYAHVIHPHVKTSGGSRQLHIIYDDTAGTTVPSTVNATSLDSLYLGTLFVPPSTNPGSDVSIAFCAVLHTEIPSRVRLRAVRMAKALYGVRV